MPEKRHGAQKALPLGGAETTRSAYFDENDSYFTPKRRGTKRLLDEGDLRVVSLAFDSFRREGFAVAASLFAAVARGVVMKSKPQLFKTKQEGVLEFSPKWASSQMASMGLMVRCATTSFFLRNPLLLRFTWLPFVIPSGNYQAT